MILHLILIATGTVFLIYGATYIWPLTRKPCYYHKLWKINFYLICFFILSYISTFIYTAVYNNQFTNHFFTTVFFFGSIYVLLTSVLSSKTIARIKAMDEIALAYEHLRYHAEHDELTGFYNRRYLMKLLDNRLQKIQFNRNKIIIMFVDLDNFKKVNDVYGHQMGDETLARLGQLLRQQLRKCDIIARYGGDEFVVVIENNKEEAYLVGEKIIHVVSQIADEKNLNHIQLGCSIGISEMNKKDSIESVLKTADLACYQAKKNKNDSSNKIIFASAHDKIQNASSLLSSST